VKAEVELPVISGLGYLDGMYLDTSADMGIVKFRELLYECLQAAGIDWKNIYIPKEFSDAEGTTAVYPYLYPFYMEISRYNFFSETDADYLGEEEELYESDTCLSVLEEFCKFFGWTLIERGRDLYFLSTADVDYGRFSYSVLKSGGIGLLDTERITKDITELTWRGNGHTTDKVQGVTKITVTADMNPVEDAMIKVDSDKLSRETVLTQTSENGDRKLYARVYGKGSATAGVEFYQFDSGWNSDNEWISYPVDWDASNVFNRFGAAFVSYEMYDTADEADKRNYNLTDALLVCAIRKDKTTSTSLDEKYGFEAVRMTNREIARYRNGAFVISASIVAMVERFNFGTTNGGGYLEFKLRVGEVWWNGTEWAETECTFRMGLGSDDSTDVVNETAGQILSTKTLDQPYNGADGYVIPIEQALGGEIELVVMVPHFEDKTQSQAIWFLFKSFKLEYYPDDGNWTKNATDRKTNEYKTLIDLFTDEKDVKLKIGSDKNNGACYASVMMKSEYVTEIYDEAASEMVRPEYALLRKLKAQYGVMKERLTLEVEAGETGPMHRISYEGKNYIPTGKAVRYADAVEELTITEV
jgi:hypothetical protein